MGTKCCICTRRTNHPLRSVAECSSLRISPNPKTAQAKFISNAAFCDEERHARVVLTGRAIESSCADVDLFGERSLGKCRWLSCCHAESPRARIDPPPMPWEPFGDSDRVFVTCGRNAHPDASQHGLPARGWKRPPEPRGRYRAHRTSRRTRSPWARKSPAERLQAPRACQELCRGRGGTVLRLARHPYRQAYPELPPQDADMVDSRGHADPELREGVEDEADQHVMVRTNRPALALSMTRTHMGVGLCPGMGL